VTRHANSAVLVSVVTSGTSTVIVVHYTTLVTAKQFMIKLVVLAVGVFVAVIRPLDDIRLALIKIAHPIWLANHLVLVILASIGTALSRVLLRTARKHTQRAILLGLGLDWIREALVELLLGQVQKILLCVRHWTGIFVLGLKE
jgi:hypothetical protein